MQRQQKVNIRDLLTDLKSCSMRRDLQWGRRIHAEVVENGTARNCYTVTALIKMYAKCGAMMHARLVFEGTEKASVVSWTALLLGYAENGEGQVALLLFSRMKEFKGVPDSVTYVAALKACTSLAVGKGREGKGRGKGREHYLEQGREIHSEIGNHLNRYVKNCLIDMYSKFSSMVEARFVFDSIQDPDVVAWNTLLQGYADTREGFVVLDLFSDMKARGHAPDSLTYMCALKACISLIVHCGKDVCLKWGRKIHLEIGYSVDPYVLVTLIDMYAKCGSMAEACRVFDSIPDPDVVAWNALLLGYVENGKGLPALNLFSTMKARARPNSVTFVAVLKACTSLAVKGNDNERRSWLERGRKLHSEIGCHLDHYLQGTLVDMYAKFGSMVDARVVFDSILKPDVVSWSALLMGYAENGQGVVALELYSRMKARGCAPNSVTYIAALKACVSLNAGGSDRLERIKEIHLEIGSSSGNHLNYHVLNTLVDVYSKCGNMEEARHVFDDIQKPNVVIWNALLMGYAENGQGLVVLELFSGMKELGCVPDSITYISVLKACALIGALALGRMFHSYICEFTAHLVTCLIDFYAKCGSMAEAREVFDVHSRARDVSTWSALLAGYASYGDTSSVFDLFESMQDVGFRPDAVTFVSMLLCCSHAGLVEKAKEYFEAMTVQYGVVPTVMHYTCMVDAMGRANQLNEAIAMIRKMPCNPNAVTWMTLLGACRKWKNVEIGSWAFQALVDLDKINASAYVLMAHIYGSRGMWEEQEKILQLKLCLKNKDTEEVR